MLKKFLIATGLVLAASAPAWSQAGQFPSGFVQGNATASAGQGKPNSVTSLLDRALGSTRGAILERGAGGWAAVGPGSTAGLAWISAGASADPAYGLLGAVGGGTNNAFFQVSGPASSIKTYAFPNANSTMAALATVQTWTGAQSFTDSDLILLGSSSGSVVLHAPATGGVSATFFSGTDTVAGLAATQTFTNKTLSSSTDVLGGVTMALGSDATGDIYYRSAGGILTRLAVGSGTQILGVSAGLPAWVSAGAGNVSNSGTPTANQIAQWTNSTTIQGISTVAPAQGGTGVASPAAHTLPINEGASAQNNTGAGTLGQAVVSQGASADPAYVSGVPSLLATLSGTAVATLSDTTHLTSSYNEYELVLENITCGTNNSTLEMQLIISGSLVTSSYVGSNLTVGSGTTAITNPTTFIQLSEAGAVQNTGNGVTGRVYFYTPSVTTTLKGIEGEGAHNQGTLHAKVIFSGQYTGSNGAVTGFQLLCNTGTVSGTAKLYGML